MKQSHKKSRHLAGFGFHKGQELLLVDESVREEYTKLTVCAGLPKKGGYFNFDVGHQGFYRLHLDVSLHWDLNHDGRVLRTEDVTFKEIIAERVDAVELNAKGIRCQTGYHWDVIVLVGVVAYFT
jgi:hypothetical protein